VEEGASIDSSKLLVTEPQLLVSKLNPHKQAVLLAAHAPGLMTVASTEFVPLIPTNAHDRYILYVWQSTVCKDYLLARCDSATRSHQRVSPQDITKMVWAWPTLAEQSAIAAFLDSETAKIDALIAEQEKLLALLADKRQATISHAVTRGLDPNAPMKDSGIPWLGEVPVHWEIVRLGALLREVDEPGNDDLPVLSVSIHDGVSDKELDEKEMDRKVSRSEDRSKYKAVLPGDLTYNMMRAWQGGFGAVTVAGMVSPAYVVARPTRDLLTSHLEMLLRTAGAVTEMKRYSRGVTDFRLRLYWDEFKTITVALPAKDEQARITAFIWEEVNKFDALGSEAERAIALLKERRSALIAAAVTGQIDVRGLIEEAA